MAQYLQLVLDLSPLRAGLWTAPSGVAFVAGALAAPAIAVRLGRVWLGRVRLVALALGLAACGFVVLCVAGTPMSLSGIVFGYILFSLGLVPVFASMTEIVVSAVPDRAGVAAGLAEISSELGGALGIAILATLTLTVFQSISPSSSGGGSIPVVAREAWGAGFSISMLLAACIAFGLAVAATKMLRPTTA